jgi:acetyl-CoA carboxylase carboxyltransferase component
MNMPETLSAPMTAQVLACLVEAGRGLAKGQPLLVLEAMKMEHELPAPADLELLEWLVAAGDWVREGEPLLRWRAQAQQADDAVAAPAPAGPRADLQAWRAREALLADAARPEAMARRHAQGLRSARENLAALCDPGSLREYGGLAFAAQTARRPVDELRAQTPADGIVTGLAEVQGRPVVVLAYDATVLAGTQGLRNHQKTDRMLQIAAERRLPVLLFAEGGGGRPGDTDMPIVAGLHVPTFASFARLAGQVPLIGIAAGRCFAGNAALLACCDLRLATRDANIGLGGPAMIEGGGLGRFEPEQVGPAPQLATAGALDLLVADEAEAALRARQLLGWLQAWPRLGEAAEQQALREAVPENRVRGYAIRPILETLFDRDSLIELGADHGASVRTAAAWLDGRPVGVIASDCSQLGGAVDGAAAGKLARFLRLCQRQGLPLVALIDCPGFMVGPEAEASGQLREVGELFQAAAALSVPLVSVVLRRAYGLGAMALAGGSLHRPLASLAWPSAEFGAMGLEGAVRLGYRKELQALPEGGEREALFERLLAQQVERGRALHMAEMLEIDAVIDPAETRAWLAQLLGKT